MKYFVLGKNLGDRSNICNAEKLKLGDRVREISKDFNEVYSVLHIVDGQYLILKDDTHRMKIVDLRTKQQEMPQDLLKRETLTLTQEIENGPRRDEIQSLVS